MNQGHLLAVLYDVTASMGQEVHLAPLLARTLQRLLFHSGYGAGAILLRDAEGTLRLAAALGDLELQRHLGQTVALPPVEPLCELPLSALENLPCRQGAYHCGFHAAIGSLGSLLLLSRRDHPPESLPHAMLQPLMGNLAKQIELCRVNDDYTAQLEREVAERTSALQEREERLSLLLESTAEGIFGVDQQGLCTFANAACVRMLGFAGPEELLGQSPHGLFHHSRADGSPFPKEECPSYRSFLLGVPCYAEEDLFWRKDGKPLPVELRSFPIRDAEGQAIGAVASFVDITEKQRRQKDEAEFREKMAQSQRLESLGLLAGGIAHDFNNLLLAIISSTELLRMTTPVDPKGDRILTNIEKASQKAAELCRQMLAYSGRGKFVVTQVHLSRLVQEMLSLLSVNIPKQIELNLQLSGDLPPVEADVAQIQQVVMNLVTNASEAIGNQPGRIAIRTGVQTLTEAERARILFNQELDTGSYVCLQVSDSGCGMSTETLHRIFEPFFTTKFTGRGLGMSAVLGILRSHKGAVLIDSEPGKGTTFKVFLPALASAPRPEDTPAPGSAPPATFAGQVLVVDDEEIVRFSAAGLLEQMGFSPLPAADGQEAIDALAREPGDFVLALLDLTMPGLSGEETFRELRKLRPDLPVILTSGYYETEATRAFAPHELAGFLQKPYQVEDLRASVQKAFRSEVRQS